MADLITGIFYDRAAAEAAVDQLETLGYEREQISVLMHDRTRAKEFADMTGTAAAGNKSSSGAKIGVGVGGALAAIVSSIAGKRDESSSRDTGGMPTTVAGSTTVRENVPEGDSSRDAIRTQTSSPQMGETRVPQSTYSTEGVYSAQDASSKPFIAGPLGATIAGASLGGLIGALAGAGVDKKLAERYERDLSAGGIVIGVAPRSDSATRVRDVLRNDTSNSSTTATGSLS